MRTEADKRTEGPQCPSSESGSRYCSQSSGCRRRTCAPVLVFVFVFVLFLLVLVLFLLVLVLFPGATSHNHPPFHRSFDRRDQDLRTLPLSSQLLLAPGLSVAAAALTAKESVRQFLYRAGVFTQHSLPATTISVGNLTSASGKTPFVMHLARHLFQFHGIPSLIVQAGGGTVDETVMMEHEFRDTPIRVVGHTSNPSDLKEILINSPGLRLVLLDNGLQHLPLQRDLDIVTVNAHAPFGGNGHLHPRGSLREPAGPALRRADAVVVHHVDIAEAGRVEETLRRIDTLVPRHTLRIQTVMVPTSLRLLLPPAETRTLDMSSIDLRSQYLGETMSLNVLQKSAVLVLTGVGSPKTVEAHLKKLGAYHVEGCGAHEDHHLFNTDEVHDAMQRARELVASGKYEHVCLMLTEKDFWRQRGFWHSVLMRFDVYDGMDTSSRKTKVGAYVIQGKLQLAEHDKRFSSATAMVRWVPPLQFRRTSGSAHALTRLRPRPKFGAISRLAMDHYRYRKNL